MVQSGSYAGYLAKVSAGDNDHAGYIGITRFSNGSVLDLENNQYAKILENVNDNRPTEFEILVENNIFIFIRDKIIKGYGSDDNITNPGGLGLYAYNNLTNTTVEAWISNLMTMMV